MKCVFVIKGIVKRFATASRTKALRIVEPSCLGSGVMLGFAAGDFAFDIFRLIQNFKPGEKNDDFKVYGSYLKKIHRFGETRVTICDLTMTIIDEPVTLTSSLSALLLSFAHGEYLFCFLFRIISCFIKLK